MPCGEGSIRPFPDMDRAAGGTHRFRHIGTWTLEPPCVVPRGSQANGALSDGPGNKITMLLAHEQDPEAVLVRLKPLTPILYRAVEAGIAESLDFFSSREQPIDTCLQPNLVRWKAKQVLDEAGHLATLEDDNVVPLAGLQFARLPIANNGLQLSYANLLLRVLKADGGGVPLAGASKARQRFYHQLCRRSRSQWRTSARLPEERRRDEGLARGALDGAYPASG